MPNFERLIRSLEFHCLDDEQKIRELKAHYAGQTKARIEILVVFFIAVVLTFACSII